MSDEHFLEDGSSVIKLGEFDGGFVVQEVFDNGDDEPSFGQPMIVKNLFAEPPTTKKHAEIQKLVDQVHELKVERSLLTDEIRQQKQQLETAKRETEAAKKLSEVDAAMKLVYDCIQGKFTHIASPHDYHPNIELAKDFTKQMPLLELRADLQDKTVQWKLSRSYMDRDYRQNVVLCQSIGAARDVVRPKVIAKLNSARDHSDMKEAIALAKRLGIEVDAKYESKSEEFRMTELEKQRQELAAKLQATEASLAK